MTTKLKEFYLLYRPLLKNRNLLKVLLAGFVSQVGSKISYFALLRKVYLLTNGSVTDLGFLTIVQGAPSMFIGPFAGAFADRKSRKRIMIACDALNGLIILGLVYAKSVSFIYVVALLKALAETFRYPAQLAFEPNLVEKQQIPLLNSFKASSNSLIQVVGSAIGAATVGLLGVRYAFVVDSATFFASSLIIAAVMVRETHLDNLEPVSQGHTPASPRKARSRDIREGLLILRDNLQVRMVLLIRLFLTLAMSMQGVLIYYFLKQTLKLGDFAELFWGYLLSALGVGGIVGSLVIGGLISRHGNRFRLFLNVLLMDSLVLATFLFNRHLPLSLLLFAFLGVIGAASQILINSILQEEVPDSKRGRIFSLMGVINAPAGAVSVFIGTVGAKFITARNVLLLAAGFEAAIALGLRFTASYRNIERQAANSEIASAGE